jgi:2-amino-4-hydroxy-6-hydroxymethyldihydropteridine diphosphokinase
MLESVAISTIVYLGLGSNLGQPIQQVKSALPAIARLPDTHLQAVSALYLTPPLGPRNQPDYVNAVARLETGLRPAALLAALKAIEGARGRRPGGQRWGPRVLDLDILLYGQAVIDEARLRVPHRELARRAFVLVPLADVAPSDLRIPEVGTLSHCLNACRCDGIRRLSEYCGAPS